MTCHICGSETQNVLDFGRQPLANALLNPGEDDKYWYNAVWAWCPKCELLQLTDVPPAEIVYTADYPYISSQSKFMDDHFKATAEYLQGLYALEGKKVLEIACNSGGIIEFLDSSVDCVGVEPAKACWPILNKKGITFYREMFSVDFSLWIKRHRQEMDLVYVANTLRSLKDLPSFFNAVLNVLAHDGVFVIEDPYLANIVERNEFDQFYSENVYGFTATSMQRIAERFGMEVIRVDALPNNHGGSLRYHLARTMTHRLSDMQSYFDYERGLLDRIKAMYDSAKKIGEGFKAELQSLKDNGQSVCGYGATAKSVTMMNWQKIGVDLLPYTYDTTPTKIGKMVPGVKVPIRDATEFKEDNSDVVALFPYNHKHEIIARENAVTRRNWLLYAPDVHYE